MAIIAMGSVVVGPGGTASFGSGTKGVAKATAGNPNPKVIGGNFAVFLPSAISQQPTNVMVGTNYQTAQQDGKAVSRRVDLQGYLTTGNSFEVSVQPPTAAGSQAFWFIVYDGS